MGVVGEKWMVDVGGCGADGGGWDGELRLMVW